MDKTLIMFDALLYMIVWLRTVFNAIFHSAALLCILFVFVPVFISDFLVQAEIEKYFVSSILWSENILSRKHNVGGDLHFIVYVLKEKKGAVL